MTTKRTSKAAKTGAYYAVQIDDSGRRVVTSGHPSAAAAAAAVARLAPWVDSADLAATWNAVSDAERYEIGC